MAFTSENVVLLYAVGNDDSLTFAHAFQQLHSLNDDQLLAVPCSSDEILSSYAQFSAQIENTVRTYLSTTSYDIQGIISGYGVPGGFQDGSDVIATTSRLSRINFSYAKMTANSLFNRQVYSSFDDSDAAQALICSRIDAPTLDIALAFVDNCKQFKRQQSANGTFFFDPYSVIENAADLQYQNVLLSFQSFLLPILNLTTYSSTFWDDYTDVIVPRLIGDSFLWAWKSNRGGYTYFEPTTTARIFLYNADSDDAGAMRDPNDKRLPMLAISSGYVTAAGAMSEPTANGHLVPGAFFSSLYQGSTIGEAFLYACPYFDWTVSLIGDPLLKVAFPSAATLTVGDSFNVGWELMHANLSSACAYLQRKENDLLAAYQDCVTNLTDAIDKVTLLPLMVAAYSSHYATWRTQMTPIINTFISFSTGDSIQSYAFDSFLTNAGTKCSALLATVTGGYVAAGSNSYDQGYWNFATTLVNPQPLYLTYQFELDIFSDAAFTDLTYTFSSAVDQTGWFYESESGSFSPVTSTGVPSSYAGRRIKYESQSATYMDRCTEYYTRFKQKDNTGASTSYITSQAIIFT
jgi:hypothetical protein